MAGRVTIKDRRGPIGGLVRELKRAARACVDVGIVGPSGQADHGEGQTIVEVATYHEFGLGVPQRSFLRDWADAEKKEILAVLRGVADEVARGRPVTQALNRAGAKFAGMVQQRISRRIPPPLAPSTVEAKGSDVPLIDTGVLRTSITWRVVED